MKYFNVCGRVLGFRSYSVSQVLQPHGASSPPGPPPPSPSSGGKPSAPAWKRPTHPPVRIDTCIVGDDTTCDAAQHERCRTELGVSSCLCRPGYSRRKHRDPCHSEYLIFCLYYALPAVQLLSKYVGTFKFVFIQIIDVTYTVILYYIDIRRCCETNSDDGIFDL